MRELASSHVKIVFDAYHMAHDQRNLDRLPELIPDLALVQLADSRRPPHTEANRCCLGEGILPLPRIVHDLLDGGYEGYWEVELLGEDVECLSYDQILRRCRNWAGNLVPADAATAPMVAKRRESRPEV
jgi:sugar phosphate isomerase/epimerase